MQGTIFNIQKFSIHDGPGIRTTVFLKGCPLRCKWCANPESQLKKPQILHDAKKCVQCRVCEKNCPSQAIRFEGNAFKLDEAKCTHCLKCVKNCMETALSYEGEKKDSDEIVEICMQDKDFYEESGGGVTISGGEGMMQPEFLKELVTKLNDKGLHTAIETTGYAKKEVFQELAPLFDLLLFDVKHANSQKHFEQTGVHNELILENLKWAHEKGLNILCRIPVIPGFNDTFLEAKEVAQLLKKIGISKIQILPFHQMGERKYEMLNRDYSMKNLKAYHPEDLQYYQQAMIDEGIDAFF